MNKKLMWVALLTFLMTSGLAVILNSLAGTGLRFDYTISRYVGMEAWSAMLFALGNVVVAGTILKYLYGVAEMWKMPRLVYWLIVVMLVGLIGLSVCPIGYFDPEGARYGTSVISLIHGLCSRTMFMAMMAVMLLVAFCKRASKGTRILAVVFVAYGVFCLLGHLLKIEWFRQTVLVFESAYLFWFMIMGLVLKSNEAKKGEING